eukprot:TCONS_00053497-protein
MTVLSFFGCTFIAFGPSVAMFALTVAPDAQQVIVFISSAFCWLLSLLATSLLWLGIQHVVGRLIIMVLISVLFQELFRFVLWKIVRRAEAGLIEMTNNHSPYRKLYFHYVAGLGFGFMSGLFAMVNILADTSGPGTLGLNGHDPNFAVISAFLTNCMILLNTFWGIVFFEGLDYRKWIHIIAVPVSHVLVSCLTLLNEQQMYWPALTVGYTLTVIFGLWSYLCVGGSIENLKRVFTARHTSTSLLDNN